MNKEILEWINKQKKSKTDLLSGMNKMRGLICQAYNSPDPIKEDLKILNQIKKELEEKDIMNYAKLKCETAPVLDDVEKRYLKNVIRPFKDRVNSICVFKTLDFEKYNQVALLIKIDEDDSYRTLIFPHFKNGTMYKGMKLDKYYTLEELDITYEEKE